MVTRPVRQECEAEGGDTLAVPGDMHVPCGYRAPGKAGRMEDCSQNTAYPWSFRDSKKIPVRLDQFVAAAVETIFQVLYS